jgi:hypothetical protein
MEADALKLLAMISRDAIVRSARNAALVAAIITTGTFISAVLRGHHRRSSPPTTQLWLSTLMPLSILFAAVFTIYFALNLWNVRQAQPLEDIFEHEAPEAELLKRPLYGFVAMEFYWLILNRTFLVFVSPDGIFGWKASGPVSNSDRRYFEPLQEMVEDKEFMRDLPAIRKLADLPGGFYYPRPEVASVASDDRNQSGMGGIPHSGHVLVRLASGKTRRLILLGEIIPEEARDRIVSILGAGVTSVV